MEEQIEKKEKPRKETFKALAQVLGSPTKAFAGEDYHNASRFLIIVILYLLWVGAALLSLQVQQTDTFKQIQYDVSMEQVENRMTGATQEQIDEAKEAVRKQLESPLQRTISLISSIVFSWAGLLNILLIWVVIIILSRMLGGEETPLNEKKHQRTWFLSLYAGIPLALSGLASGILTITKNPDSYRNILSMTDYIREMQVSPSLYYVFRPDGFYPGVFLSYILATLTDPFSWWGYFVLFAGMKGILRMEGKKSVIIIAILILLTGGFTWLLQLPAQMMGN